MEGSKKTYAVIDLKSFYASVECVARGLDPFTTNLVVADPDRGDGTICLALSPALKRLGLPGRCRVFEIPREIPFIKARPRMRLYMQTSAQIVEAYLAYISPDDLHVYSIDECFMDLTPYLSLYHTSAEKLARLLMQAVYRTTNITATAGIGPNLFLAKVALDLFSKQSPTCLATLDEKSYQARVWPHKPITDIWQVGKGIARRLSRRGLYTMGDVAHADIEELYQEFGINAEYLIDHAWGLEPCTIADIKAYKPAAHSISNGQVLPKTYTRDEAAHVLLEMVDESALELVEKGLATSHISLYVGYSYHEPRIPSLHVSRRLDWPTNSCEELFSRIEALYTKRVLPSAEVKRLGIAFGDLVSEKTLTLRLHTDYARQAKERARQGAIVAAKKRFGEDAILRGASYLEKGRGLERAHQIGGHHE